MYAFSFLPGPIQKEIPFPEADYKKQQRKLGVWHDTAMAVAFLSMQNREGLASDSLLQLQEKEKRQFNKLF